MKNIICALVLLATLAACTNNQPAENKTATGKHTDADTSENSVLQTGCYVYEKDGNNIKLHITAVNEQVTGALSISYAEKDKNQGTFIGSLHGDKLAGIYTFQSEGTESSREIAFLVKGNQLIEGYGPMNETGTAFKDVNTIEYTSTMPLTKADCDQK